MVSKQSSFLRKTTRIIILKLQKSFQVIPKNTCLITGAPRSGTTAICNWLGVQHGVLAFQESRIPLLIHRLMEEAHRFCALNQSGSLIISLAQGLAWDYYSTSNVFLGKKLLIEKEPLEPIAFPEKDYQKFLNNYRRVFPQSKLLFIVRDPIATIWSMSKRSWGGSLVEEQSKEFTLEEYIENWRACIDLVMSYRSDSNTYVIQYGNLVRNPVIESKRIYDFLEIKSGDSFEPRQTKEIGFSNDEREKILFGVQTQLDLLLAQGISNLS